MEIMEGKMKDSMNKAEAMLTKQLLIFLQNSLANNSNNDDNDRREIRLPSSISKFQLDHLVRLSKKMDHSFLTNWLFPVYNNCVVKNDSHQLLLKLAPEYPIEIGLSIGMLVKRQMSKFSIIKSKKSRINDQYKNNFNLFTYFETKPIVPKLIQKQTGSVPDFIWPSSNGLERLLEKMAPYRKQIKIISGLNKEDKLDVLMKINNDCGLNMKPCRIVYLQCSSINTFWMALKAKETFNDKWNAIGYQITLESKTSLNNSIIFFEIATFIRVLNRDLNMTLITHLMIDIGQNHLFFNLLFLYIKENLDNLRHLNIFLLTTGPKQSRQMRDYFRSETVHFDYGQYHSEAAETATDSVAENENFKFIFLDDIVGLKLLNGDEISLSSSVFSQQHQPDGDRLLVKSNHNDHATNVNLEFLLFECWHQRVDIQQMVEFLKLFPWQIDYQCIRLNGINALIVAVIRGIRQDVYRLLALGANCRIPSWDNLEPIQWAIICRKMDIFQLLFVHQYAQNPSFDLNLQNYYLDKFMVTVAMYPDQWCRKRSPRTPLQSRPSTYQVDYELILRLLPIMIRQIHFSCKSRMGLPVPPTPPGSILIMLPSYNSVSTLRKLIISTLAEFEFEFVIFCLYPHVPNNELDAGIGIITAATKQVRVILSTFNADSVLLNDIHFVINTGVRLEKVQSYFSDINVFQLVANQFNDPDMKGILLNQRMGQVKVFNLFKRNDPLYRNSADRHHHLNDSMNIISTDSMYHCIFAAKCFNFKNNQTVDIFSRMISQPKPEIIANSLVYLKNINVLNENEELTELGKILIDLSIEPHYAKMIIFSVILRCLDPILTIVCSLSTPNSLFLSDVIQICSGAWQTENNQYDGNDVKTENSILESFSDHLTYIYAFQKWQEISRSNVKACDLKTDKRDIIFSSFEIIYSLRTKILGQLRAIGFVKGKGSMNIRNLNSNSDNFSLIKAAICAGQPADYFTMITSRRLNQCAAGTSAARNEIIHIDPSSVLNFYNPNMIEESLPSDLPSNLVMFDRKINCGQTTYIQNCTLINPLTMAIFADEQAPGGIAYQPDGTIQFNGLFNIVDPNNQKVFALRQQWQQFVKKRLFNIQTVREEDETFLRDLIQLITASDDAAEFRSHPSIGRAPQVMSTYFCSTIRIKK